MPLSPAVPRKRLHERNARYEGFARDDGLFDVEAHLLNEFRKTLHDAFGGVQGCTHLIELLGYLPTAAVQMFAGLKKREDEGEHKPFQLDRCHALETTSDVVRRYYPKWYRGAA